VISTFESFEREARASGCVRFVSLFILT
jgi:hypothetical protein